jgi:hypothetical protein
MAFETFTEADLVRGLVRGYAEGHQVEDELQRLGVLSGRRFESLEDEYAGYLVAAALAGTKAGRRTITIDGEQLPVQVRGAHRTLQRRPKYFPVDYAPGEKTFAALALVIFDIDWTVADAYMIPWDELGHLIVPGKKRHGWRLPCGGSWRSDPAALPLRLRGR